MTLDDHDQASPPTSIKPFKVSVTFWHATTELFNLFMVFASVSAIFGAVFLFMIYLSDEGQIVPLMLAGLFFLLGMVSLLGQIWGMYSLSIESVEQGIRYKVAARNIFIAWDKVRMVHIEPLKKQITFWTDDNKLTRIHYFGLRPADTAIVKSTILEQAKARNITVK